MSTKTYMVLILVTSIGTAAGGHGETEGPFRFRCELEGQAGPRGGTRTEAAVPVVDHEIAAHRARRKVVHTASAVRDIAHDQGVHATHPSARGSRGNWRVRNHVCVRLTMRGRRPATYASRMSAMTHANMSRPSGNCSATVCPLNDACDDRVRQQPSECTPCACAHRVWPPPCVRATPSLGSQSCSWLATATPTQPRHRSGSERPARKPR